MLSVVSSSPAATNVAASTASASAGLAATITIPPSAGPTIPIVFLLRLSRAFACCSRTGDTV